MTNMRRKSLYALSPRMVETGLFSVIKLGSIGMPTSRQCAIGALWCPPGATEGHGTVTESTHILVPNSDSSHGIGNSYKGTAYG